jgi:eukaryotic-like serine/threonine-protein kinase
VGDENVNEVQREAPRGVIAGRYRLRELVGTGGMGTVWLATDELLDRDVAIKRVRLVDLPPVEAAIARDRTLSEARIAAKLHHPHIVSIFDVVQENNEPWLVLEFLPSRSLGEVLAERGPLPPADVAAIGAQLAAALAAAHSKGIVHRDVKPDNVLIARSPGDGQLTVKLTDFGISYAASAPSLTATNVVIGTPAYFAPETARGGRSDARSDVYALGATLYAAVEGHPPFGWGDGNALTLLARIGHGGAPPPMRAGPLTEPLRALTADDPAARPTAAQAHHMLEQLAQSLRWGGPAPWTDPAATAGPPDRRRRRGRLVAAGVAVLAAAALTLVAIFTFPGGSVGSPPPPAPAPAETPTSALAIGDPQTADPCALLNAEELKRYGLTAIDPDNIRFGACRANVTRLDQSEVVVEAFFENQLEASAGAYGTPEQIGPLTVVRYQPVNNVCDRRVMLPDRNAVLIGATGPDPAAAPTETCEIADTATRTAVDTLIKKGISRKVPLDATSPLARFDACGLLQQSELAAVPGLSLIRPSFGGWGCHWRTNTDPATTLDLFFNRELPLADVDGQPADFAGRTGRLKSEPGRCEAKFAQRQYIGGNGSLRVEVVWLILTGPGSDAELCQVATTLATAAAAKLPPPT